MYPHSGLVPKRSSSLRLRAPLKAKRGSTSERQHANKVSMGVAKYEDIRETCPSAAVSIGTSKPRLSQVERSNSVTSVSDFRDDVGAVVPKSSQA